MGFWLSVMILLSGAAFAEEGSRYFDQDVVSSKTQSASPAELLPGVEKVWLAEFWNGEPGIVIEMPLV